MKIFLRIVFSVCLFLPVVSWGAITCSGEVTNAYIGKTGNLVIRGSWRNDYTKLCNVNDDPIVCSLWSGYVAKSMDENTSLIVRYTNPSTTCDSLPRYSSSPAPEYVMLIVNHQDREE